MPHLCVLHECIIACEGSPRAASLRKPQSAQPSRCLPVLAGSPSQNAAGIGSLCITASDKAFDKLKAKLSEYFKLIDTNDTDTSTNRRFVRQAASWATITTCLPSDIQSRMKPLPLGVLCSLQACGSSIRLCIHTHTHTQPHGVEDMFERHTLDTMNTSRAPSVVVSC